GCDLGRETGHRAGGEGGKKSAPSAAGAGPARPRRRAERNGRSNPSPRRLTCPLSCVKRLVHNRLILTLSPMKLKPLLQKTPLRRLFDTSPVVTVLPLYGAIAPGGGKLRGEHLNLAGLAEQIEKAFSAKHLAAVALAVNSPGGSPVQSALIFDRIRQLAEEKDVPVYAFAEDVMASGGYWLALAADEIYVNKSSIIGSIGVVSAGFGFPALLDKLGVDRRIY